jgi:hypothetical protein
VQCCRGRRKVGLADAERRVLDGVETPSAAADRILDAFGGA